MQFTRYIIQSKAQKNTIIPTKKKEKKRNTLSPFFLSRFLLRCRSENQKIHPSTTHTPTPAPTQIPATFSTATLSPARAARVRRPALPRRLVDMFEKTSFYTLNQLLSFKTLLSARQRGGGLKREGTNSVIQRILIPRIVVNINRNGFQRRCFVGEGVEEFVVLPGSFHHHSLIRLDSIPTSDRVNRRVWVKDVRLSFVGFAHFDGSNIFVFLPLNS